MDDPEQPTHELDVLRGHENDVNYVQFRYFQVNMVSLLDCAFCLLENTQRYLNRIFFYFVLVVVLWLQDLQQLIL